MTESHTDNQYHTEVSPAKQSATDFKPHNNDTAGEDGQTNHRNP